MQQSTGMKHKLVELSLELITVMIGVYLGFVATNWSDSQKRTREAKILVENILSEIETNKEKLSKVIDYHKMLQDSSSYYAYQQEIKTQPHFFKGTRTVNLSQSAYNTGTQTGIINELPIDKIQLLNELYTSQNAYNDLGKMILSSLINKDFSNDPKSWRAIAQFLSISMTDVIIQETGLMEAYESVAKQLK